TEIDTCHPMPSCTLPPPVSSPARCSGALPGAVVRRSHRTGPPLPKSWAIANICLSIVRALPRPAPPANPPEARKTSYINAFHLPPATGTPLAKPPGGRTAPRALTRLHSRQSSRGGHSTMTTLARHLPGVAAAPMVLALCHIDPALAREASEAVAGAAGEAAAPDTGDTAWMLTATALVLMMTVPGLALFYGGMVRRKNVLSVVMQAFAITCLMTIVWLVAGCSLAFTDGGALNLFVGGLSKMFLAGVHPGTLSGTIPETVFFTFQATFAIITPVLIVGAVVDRMKFSAVVIFMVLWSLVVYAPVTHWVWGGGFLSDAGVLDFAGGTVVHINAGVAGLVCAIFLGRRHGYGHENMAPHNLVYSLIGASLLWVGWFGFNAGSAVAA